MTTCITGCVCDLFFFNDTATTEIYTLSLHDALPILLRDRVRWRLHHWTSWIQRAVGQLWRPSSRWRNRQDAGRVLDRKSTRLNSSHANISYAVFCLKKEWEQDVDEAL